MRDRRRPKTIPPDHANYFALDVEGRGETWWRVPFPIFIAPLLQAHADAVLRDQSSLERAMETMMVAGAAIGLCWCDPERELHAGKREHGSDLIGYGEAVLDELHDDGWTAAQVGEVAPAIIKRITAAAATANSEVQARVGFSRARRAEAH
tara:strand:- start:4789 stop:5241 length:453 start_codon:yes stop_codon:yes gene_type:complete